MNVIRGDENTHFHVLGFKLMTVQNTILLIAILYSMLLKSV